MLPGTRIVGLCQALFAQLYEPMHLQSLIISSSLSESSGGIETIARGLPESPSFLFFSTSKALLERRLVDSSVICEVPEAEILNASDQRMKVTKKQPTLLSNSDGLEISTA